MQNNQKNQHFGLVPAIFLSLYLPINFDKSIPHFQFVNSFSWFNNDSLRFSLGVDGLSMPFIILSTFLILACIIFILPQAKKNMKMYLASFLVLESFLIGTFSALDLFSFYIFFESILIPMYLIIGFWGGERRIYSAYKFFSLYSIRVSLDVNCHNLPLSRIWYDQHT